MSSYRIGAFKKQGITCPESDSFFQELRDEGLSNVNDDGSINVVIRRTIKDEAVYFVHSEKEIGITARRLYDDFLSIEMYAVVIAVYEDDELIITLDTNTGCMTLVATGVTFPI